VSSWSVRRWSVAGIATLLSALVFGLPTDLIPNPVFSRQIEAPAWSYPALIVTAVLSGLLLATYVSDTPRSAREIPAADSRRMTAGGLLAFFAIGCPTCNKLVLLALGSTGAITWFEPVQPLMALGGIALLAVALRKRLRTAEACEVPLSRA
jgi:hypothetical protein